MKKSSVTFDWQELEEGKELPPIPTPDKAPRISRPRLERPLLIGGAVLLLTIALLLSQWVSRQAQMGLAQIHQELALAVDAEVWAEHQTVHPSGEMREYVLTQMRHEQVASVQVETLHKDMAAVMIVTEANISDNGPATTYRQLHFYRRTTQGWQPLKPIPALWGQLQHLTTQHFEFTYRSRDIQAVQAVAAELDELYVQMRRNLGLPPTPAYKLAIEVVVESVSGSRGASGKRPEHIIVSSPALFPASDWLSDAEILRQSILLELASKAIEEAIQIHPIPPRWYPLLTPMRLWLIWDAGGPPAAWREPMLRAFYMDLQRLDHQAAPLLPIEYIELCTLYSLWEDTPLQMGLFSLCHTLDQATLHAHTDWETLGFMDFIRMPSSRFFVTSIHDAYDEEPYVEDRFRWVVQIALLDYAAATYGREQVGVLWAVLHKHDDWTTLIPAVFSISVAEFESDWQAYLENRIDD